ncbi:UTP11-like, U3 small nucleolar ribonucleoprotein [Branchiostoma belcheri]|nr:UTP11-like, U3 small nucleolar ribonucleoprotein [Branchiostoma belcheri]
MSSFKKAAKARQKDHKERGQLSSRSHLGLLEKKKDYKLRSKDYHNKQGILKRLKQKALEHNPDEFYFHMINSRLKGGKHSELQTTERATPEQKKLMQTQDIRYVDYKLSAEAKKVEKLQSELHMIGHRAKNKHTFFLDSKEEVKDFDLANTWVQLKSWPHGPSTGPEQKPCSHTGWLEHRILRRWPKTENRTTVSYSRGWQGKNNSTSSDRKWTSRKLDEQGEVSQENGYQGDTRSTSCVQVETEEEKMRGVL